MMEFKKRFDRVYIELSNICNFNCPFCSGSMRQKQNISLSEFKNILQQIKPYTNEVCLHVLGEPLLYYKLDEILTLCESANLKVYLVSNGYFILNKMDLLLKHGKVFNKINFSLNSYIYNEHLMHEKINEIVACAKVLAQQEILVELRNLNDENNTKLHEPLNNAFKKNFNTSLININSNQKLGKHIYYVVKKLFTWPDKTNNLLNTSNSLKVLSKKYCLALRTHVAILSNLDVVPCCLDSTAKIKLGNLKNEQFADIISSKMFKEMFESFGKGKAPNDFCKNCTYNNSIKNKNQN